MTKHIFNVDGVSLNAAISQAEINGNVKSGTELLTRSSDIASMMLYWDLTDTIIDGIVTLRENSTKYLPKFAGEDKDVYEMRLGLTKFTNVYRDIIESLSSKPFEEQVTLIDTDKIQPHEEIKKLIEDIDGDGANLTEFASQTFFNGIKSAIDWIFVDFPINDDETTKPKNQAEFKAAGLRPYWSHVIARNVIVAKTTFVGGKSMLSFMRILEPMTDNGDGIPADHVRVFQRDNQGNINWELWKKVLHHANLTEQKFVLVQSGVLSINVIPLVPFITGRREGRTFKFLPALQDAADLSLELYLQESGLKYAKTVSAYAMLVGEGVKPEKEGGKIVPLNIGPMKVLYAPPNAQGQNGTWKFIQPEASVLTFLKEDIKETKEDLRELGRQPLTAQSSNLTTISAAAASGKAKSAVSAWALGLKNALENALGVTMLWFGQEPGDGVTGYKPEVDVYTEFDDVLDDGKDLTALKDARTGGDLSRKTYWLELKRRRVLSAEFDAEKEKIALLDDVPGEDGGINDNLPPKRNPEIQPGKAE
jgi:hypothetical protein